MIVTAFSVIYKKNESDNRKKIGEFSLFSKKIFHRVHKLIFSTLTVVKAVRLRVRALLAVLRTFFFFQPNSASLVNAHEGKPC